ncbi:hypothetical protein BG015_006856 [Linnemannia schmuckeri]|uniref:LIM zinc-binding domain-containing protein n=1 Tax=Linnemannia schmuckeri TaxID=64567 RepID=A0A9P5VBP0_9FUNG|nr:hypothetical protein BG015_006856 [Linnemannia schmuckeri]
MSVKDPRLSQILPVIRCSDCGDDVVFRKLGEHVCRGTPALPVQPLSIKHSSPTVGKNAGAYRPGHKPPPIPSNASDSKNFNTSPLSPSNTSSRELMSSLRPTNGSSPRPSLPFLEKYAKMTKGSSPPAPLPQSNSDRQDQAFASYGANQQHQQQLQLPRSSSHYQREQNDYFAPKPTEDRFAVAAAFAAATASDTQRQQFQGNQTVVQTYVPRAKTPTAVTNEPANSSLSYSSPNSSFTSRTSHYNQPAVPQKSTARTPSIASVHALGGQGNQGYDYSKRSKSSLGNNSGQSPYTSSDAASRDRERDRIRQRANRSAPIPDYGPQFSHHISTPTAPLPVRSGSSASTASTVTERRTNRNRSNTMQSEQSEITLRSEPIRSRTLESNTTSTDRYGRSERERGRERVREREKELPLTPSSSRSEGSSRRLRDAASAYKTPSPPVSLRGDDSDKPAVAAPTKGSTYRPPTPPEIASPVPTRGRRSSIAQPSSRKATGGSDQFDALMEDLLQQIDILPKSSSPSSRNSTRDSTRRSRSRSLAAESGGRNPMLMDEHAATAPPTPQLPTLSSSNNNSGNTGMIMGGSRSDSPSTASVRSQQRRLERERSERSVLSVRENGSSSPRPRRERSDSDRENTRGRDRARSSSSTTLSSRSRSAHPSTSSTVVATASRHPCQGCQYEIRPLDSDQSIKMDRVGDFHAECFKCTRCRKVLDSARHAHEFEGRPYCDKDYSRMVEREKEKEKLRIQRRRLPTCAGCDGSIHSDETTVYALGQTWHDHHLQCSHCHKPIVQPSNGNGQPGHVEKNGRVYCFADFADLFLPKCRGCNKPVEKEAVSAQDGKLKGKWHTACFGCHTCQRPFPDKSFYVFGDAPYCRRHYHKMNKSLCKTCNEPIEGPCAQTVEGWRYHPNCFSCAECRTPLTDVYYNFENKAYCERDIAIIQRTRSDVRAERRRTFFGRV